MKQAFRLWDSLRWWSAGFWRCSVREEYQSMRSAQCASAPSHPLHVMPSRITRNSHRPRASDRTMVASEATSSLAALSNSMASSPSAEKPTRMDNKPNFSREVKLQWAGSRERISPSGRGGAFFLTSLFIELIDRMMSSYRPVYNSRTCLDISEIISRRPETQNQRNDGIYYRCVYALGFRNICSSEESVCTGFGWC